jgi:membrane protease YdiL (CAAX protease family)
MRLVGPDFRAGLRAILYRLEPAPGLWMSIGIFAVLAGVNQLLQAVMALGIHALSGQEFSDQTSLLRSAMLGVLPAAVLTIGLAWMFASRRGSDPKEMLRFRMPAFGSLGWATAIVSFLVVMHFAAALLITLFSIAPDNVGDVENAMKGLVNDPVYPLVAVGIVLAAPLAEELTFRGQIFAALARTRLGFSGTTVLTSAAWAGLHIGEPIHAVALLFVMGLVLGFLLVRFGSLWVCFVCHAVWNGIFALALLGAGQ